MAEEIIFKVGVNTSGAEKSIDQVDKELKDLKKTADSAGGGLEKRFADLQKRVASGTLTQRELTKAVKEYQTIALQAGETSPIGQQAIAEAGELSDRIGDLSARVRVAGHDGANMQAALQLGQGVIAGYGALQGITALVGEENEELTQTLVKLQGAQAALASIEQLRTLTEAESAVMIKGKIILEKAYALAVGESTGALKVFRLALIATGIGALVAVIAALIANWDQLTGAISESSIAAEGLADTMEDYRKGAEDAIKQTKDVKVAFDLAREGVISKDEALKLYNDTLGDSFGKAKDLNEAEALYAAKTDAYIKATAMRRQADALLTKAAEEYAASLTASMEDQTGFWDQQIAGIQRQYGFFGAAQETLNESQREGVKEQQALHKQRNDIFTQAAEQLLKDAETVETANGIKSESEQKLADDRQKLADEAAKKRQAELDKQREEENARLEELQRLQREITDLTIAAIEDRAVREQMALAEKHRRELEDLRKQYGERAELIRSLEEKQELERRALDNQQLEQDRIDREEAMKSRDASRQQEKEANVKLSKGVYDIWRENADKQRLIDEALFESKVNLANNIASVFGTLSQLAKQNSAAQKAFAVTEIAINTATGFMDGLRLAQKAAIETPTPIGKALVFGSFIATQTAAVLNAADKAKSIIGSGVSVSPPTASAGTTSGAGSTNQSQSVGSNTTTDTNDLQNQGQTQFIPVLSVQSLKQVEKSYDSSVMIATWP